MDLEPDETKTLTTNLETLSISDPLFSTHTSLTDIYADLETLEDLAARGSWRSIVDSISRSRKLTLPRKPHEHLIHSSYYTLALTKLRRFADAADELGSLGDFDGSRYRYESYPEHYTDVYGSMVPFALRWIHTQLPQSLGKRQETLDRLYTLLDFVRSRLRESESETLDRIGRWRKREEFVINSIIANHLSHKEFGVSLMLIRDLISRSPSDPVLLSKLGYIQMQFGDLDGSRLTFTRIEKLIDEEESNRDVVELKNLVNRNKAMVYLVSKDYVSAVREYEVCIERDPADVVAINNKALCLMYLRDLSDSIKVLESGLERVPTVALNETLVMNLCSMYELAYINHSEIKRTLSNWIARVAPDDFDSACTRT